MAGSATRIIRKQDLETLTDLPSAPKVVIEIWRVLSDEGASVRALSDVVEQDPALSAKILRLTNSAYFGLPRPVEDVRTACVVLGFSTVESLAVGVTALEALSRSVSRAFSLDDFWRHSVATAIAAESLAKNCGLAKGGTAFCAGILHDVGKLVLATIDAPRYRAVLEMGGNQCVHEEGEYGVHHGVVGGWLAERWGFPDDLAEAVRGHHEPHGEAGGKWASLIHVADRMASACGWSAPGRSAAEFPAADTCPDLLPWSDVALAAARRELEDQRGRVGAFLSAARSA